MRNKKKIYKSTSPHSSLLSRLNLTPNFSVLHTSGMPLLLPHIPPLTQHGSLPWGTVLQDQTAPSWVTYGVTSPASKAAPAWAPLPVGPYVLLEACSSMGSPWGHSLLQESTCSSLGSFMGWGWISDPL